MALEDVKKYYAVYDDWARLEQPTGRLEFERSMSYLERFLTSPCHVLDLGGGPGRYSIALAKRGHRVTLADLSPEQLAIARRKVAEADVADKVGGFNELNATDLGCFGADSFDAVVAFGPFYHLIDTEDRHTAAREIARVVRPGGFVFVVFIPPFFHLTHLIVRAVSSPEQVCRENFAEGLEQQVFINRHGKGFQHAYLAYPTEIREILEDAGLRCELAASLRGIANEHAAELYAIAERDPDLYAAIMEALDRSSTIPSVIETGGHAISVARKPA